MMDYKKIFTLVSVSFALVACNRQEEVTPTMSHFPFMGERAYAHSNALIISIPSGFCM